MRMAIVHRHDDDLNHFMRSLMAPRLMNLIMPSNHQKIRTRINMYYYWKFPVYLVAVEYRNYARLIFARFSKFLSSPSLYIFISIGPELSISKVVLGGIPLHGFQWRRSNKLTPPLDRD